MTTGVHTSLPTQRFMQGTTMSAIQDGLTSLWDVLDMKTSLLGLTAAYAAWRVYVVVSGLRGLDGIPRVHSAFDPFSLFGATLPVSSWNLGLNFQWMKRRTLYRELDSIVIVPYLWGTPRIWTANLESARQVIAAGPGAAWFKPQEYSQAVLLWGMNLVGADHNDIWRRHRRIMGPAFNNKTYALVWDETMRIYRSMVKEEGWMKKASVDIPVIQTYTFKFALFIIAGCGFGLPFEWSEPPQGVDGKMNLQEALRLTSEWNFARVMLPKWFWKLPIAKFRYIESAYQTLDSYMKNQVRQRKAEIRKELTENGGDDFRRNDVFSRLVLANESETEKLPLDDQELIGNTFVLLFAGHETTGHTLAGTLGFLGIYQEEQDIVYEQIVSVLGNDREPTFEDYSALYKVLAAFYEALRLIPAGSVMIREAAKDTILTVPNAIDKEGVQEIAISKGTIAMVDMVGVQYNPRYFPDPHLYKPSRWYDQETGGAPDSFTAFSVGPRACIGRRFAAVEAVCWLAMLLRDFKVEVPSRPGETREETRERVLQAQLIMTLSVGDVPIRLIRRYRSSRG